MSKIDRRNLLTAAPAAGFAALVAGAVPVGAMVETPVQRAYHEWKRSLDAWNADMERDSSDENGDRWCHATYRLADAVVNTPSTGPMDLVYKLMAYCFNGQHELSLDEGAEPIWSEARALVGA